MRDKLKDILFDYAIEDLNEDEAIDRILALFSVSESKSYDVASCITSILSEVEYYRMNSKPFHKDYRVRFCAKKAIDKMLYSR